MLLHIIIGALGGFILGALVYRNNSAKFDALIEKVKQLEQKIEDKIK